jgi:hypothetical protein
MSQGVCELDEEIFSLVAKAAGVPRPRLGLETDLYSDLGVTGDDAELLLVELARSQNVDLSAIRFDRHFTGEALFSEGKWWPPALSLGASIILGSVAFVLLANAIAIPYPLPEWGKYLLFAGCVGWALAWAYLANLLLPSARRWRRERVPVKIKDLIAAVKEKKWQINYEGN